MYLMPDTVKTLYWWGYESDNLEDTTNANGWGASYTTGTVTRNVNSATLNNLGIGTKNAINTSSLYAIVKSDNIKASIGIVLRSDTVKSSTFLSNDFAYQTVANSIGVLHSTYSTTFSCVAGVDGRTGTVYAYWYE